jgi:hypothetical protein
MEKKTIFLELPAEIIDNIDRQNHIGDRSLFISDLLQKQLDQGVSMMNASSEFTKSPQQAREFLNVAGEISLLSSNGSPLGKFNINTIEGLEDLSKKICELTDNPTVRMQARLWR